MSNIDVWDRGLEFPSAHPHLLSGVAAQVVQKRRVHAVARRRRQRADEAHEAAVQNAQKQIQHPPPGKHGRRASGPELHDARNQKSLPAAIDPIDHTPWPMKFGRGHKSDAGPGVDGHRDILGNKCVVVEAPRGAAPTVASAAASTAAQAHQSAMHPAAILLSQPDALDEWLVCRHTRRHCKAGASTLTAQQQLMEANINQWRTVAGSPTVAGAQQSVRAVPLPPSPRVLELAKSRSVRPPVARGEAAAWGYGVLGGQGWGK